MSVPTNRIAIESADAPAPVGPYSQAIAAQGSMVFTAGQIALDPQTGAVVSDDVAEQTEQVLKNLSAVLAAAGTSLANTIKTTVFLADMNDFGAMNEVYATFFTGTAPARSCVQAARLPKDVKVEIEAIALR